MTEQEMGESKVPTFDTVDQVAEYINGLVSQDHDYGTCCYAMSMAAVAAFNHVARKLGVTGFQASCADMDILRRTRHMERFQIVDLSNLLYPQYRDKFKGFEGMLAENAEWLSVKAKKKLEEEGEAHPAVKAWWEMLARLTSEEAPSMAQEARQDNVEQIEAQRTTSQGQNAQSNASAIG